MNRKIILVVCLFLFGCATSVKERNISSLSTKDIDDLWVVVSKSQRKDSLIRTNPQHFWAWMEANSKKELDQILKYEGAVTADPHFFNFADVHAPGAKNGLALVDVDDAGQAPFILDFIRYSLFVKAYVKDQHSETNLDQLLIDMFQAYLNGLNQKQIMRPAVLQKAINQNYEKLIKENEKWVDTKLDDPKDKDYGLRKKELGLLDTSKIPIKREEAAKDLRNSIVKQNKVSEVYDIGFTVNDSGSSRGLSRYWMSVRTANEGRRIIECKELSRASVDYYQNQKDHTTRISEVLKYYSDVQTSDSYVLNVGTDSYWCRPREFKFIRRSDIEQLSKTEMKELSLYLAYWIGSKQSLQPTINTYVKNLEKVSDMVARIDQLINKYEREIDALSVFKK